MSDRPVCGRVSLQLDDGSVVTLYGPLSTLYVLIPNSLVLITDVEISFTEPPYEALTTALTTVTLRSSSIVQYRQVKSLADYYCRNLTLRKSAAVVINAVYLLPETDSL